MGPIPTNLLRTFLQRKVLAVAVTAAAVGGGRLLHDEVRLVGHSGGSTGLLGQQQEALLACKLVLDLSTARHDQQRLEDQNAAITSQVLALEVSLDAARGAQSATERTLGQAKDELARASADGSRLGTALAAANDEVRARAAALTVTRTDLGAARRELEAAEVRARYLASDLQQAQQIAQERADEVAKLAQQARAERESTAKVAADLEATRRERVELVSRLTAADEARKARETEAAELRGRLVTAERERDARGARATAAEDALSKVARSGVNVDRLTGARPLPSVTALVVQVEVDLVPPVVTIDAGSAAKLEKGDHLSILRSGQVVAEVELDDVKPQLSSGRVIRGQRGLRLRPGDSVTTMPVR